MTNYIHGELSLIDEANQSGLNKKVETIKNKKEVRYEDTEFGLKGILELTTWLAPGTDKWIGLSPRTADGLTREELMKVESLSARRTVVDADPPLSFFLKRSTNGKINSFDIVRWSGTNREWENLFSASLDYTNGRVYLNSRDDVDKSLELTSEVFSIISKNRKKIASTLAPNEPNNLLMRTHFTTSREDAYWMQLKSPLSKIVEETANDPWYRLYINSQFPTYEEYFASAGQIATDCRNYNKSPLCFKILYSGEGAKQWSTEAESTKIVFYFDDLQKANEFGDWLANRNSIKSLPKGADPNFFVPQKQWQDGLLVLGKGAKEHRQKILHELEKVKDISMREALLESARELEIAV